MWCYAYVLPLERSTAKIISSITIYMATDNDWDEDIQLGERLRVLEADLFGCRQPARPKCG